MDVRNRRSSVTGLCRASAAAALVAALAVGCLAPMPPPGPTISPAPSGTAVIAQVVPTRSPAITPIPGPAERSAAFDGLDGPDAIFGPDDPVLRRATVDLHGIRVTIETERNPMRAGQATWVTTILTNTGHDTLRWITDGCSIHVGVRGEMAMHWQAGFVQAGAAKTFKDWAFVAEIAAIEQPIMLDLTPEPFVLQGDFGCADLGIPHSLEPGRRIVERHQWAGDAAPHQGPPPSGPARLIATFRSWWRGPADLDATNDEIVVRLPVQIVDGRDPRLMSAGQAIDVALTVPAFRRLLETHPSIQDWDMPVIVRFNEAVGAWQVGFRTYDRESVLVDIDPLTAEIVRIAP
jgi:hypothetical protein